MTRHFPSLHLLRNVFLIKPIFDRSTKDKVNTLFIKALNIAPPGTVNR